MVILKPVTNKREGLWLTKMIVVNGVITKSWF